RKVTAATGIISTIAGGLDFGYGGDNGPSTKAVLNGPEGMAVDQQGNLYIADRLDHRIRKIALGTGIITTVAGNGTPQFSGDDGPATAASLNGPYRLALDRSGNLYIADTGNRRIRKLDMTNGTISTVAGNGNAGDTGDGGPAKAASFMFPSGVTIDTNGNLLI